MARNRSEKDRRELERIARGSREKSVRWPKGKVLANHQPEPFGETIRQALSALDGLPAKEVLRIHRRDVRGLLVAYF